MYRLIYEDGEQQQLYEFSSGEVVIGRSPECQICLKDFGISRNHAKIVVDDGGVRLVDLKSKNGTQVNGVPIVEAPLKDGDQILLGKFQLSFGRSLEGQVVLDEAKPLEEAGTIIRSVGDISKLLAGQEKTQPGEVTAAEEEKGKDIQEIENANRILKVLTNVAETLIAVRPVEEVLTQVVDIVFENIPADRGFLMLEEGGDKLVPMVVKHRKPGGANDKGITISKTIAEKVMKEKVSILTSDAQVDARFSAGDSIRFHGIRSAMCAPLWNRDQVIGIIFVDSLMLTNCFTANDLDMLTALANYAAVAVERSRLNQKIVAEEKKRDRLGRFLSPQVASRILATSDSQDNALGVPEVREVTVLFSDICGFTSMSEKMSPSSVALLLNDYLSRMTDVIFKQEGTLDKFIGDAIMAVFGAPIDMPDHASRAIKSALDMMEQLDEFNNDHRDGPKLQIRIGINSGKAVACEIGSINKKEYTVLGDTVNTASRLESSVAKPMMIVVGENTYEAVKGRFDMKPLGKATLKGKQKEVVAYQVLGELPATEATVPPSTQPEL
jgi:adenylate cyclase